MMPALLKRTILFVTTIAAVHLMWGCTEPGPGIADRGGSEVIGTLVRQDSLAISGAKVELLTVTTSDSAGVTVSDTVVEKTTYSEMDGTFEFKSLNRGHVYILYASYNNDSLLLPPKTFITDPAVVENNLGLLVMKAPAAIRGMVIRQTGGTSQNTFCSIAGTSFLAIVNTENDSFILSGLIPDTVYSLTITSEGYFPEIVPDIPVVAGMVADLPEPIYLKLDTAGIPPSPTGLVIGYDTLSGKASLTWNNVNVDDVSRYIVFGFIGSVATTDTVSDTNATVTIYPDSTDTAKQVAAFQVAALDNDNMVGYRCPLDTIDAVPPGWLRMTVSLRAIDDMKSGDSVYLALSYSGKIRTAVQSTWWVDHPDSIIANKTLPGMSIGIDTVVWVAKTGKDKIYASITDNAGKVWIDSINASSFEHIDRWEAADSMIYERRYGGACEIDGKIYVFGGCTDWLEYTPPIMVGIVNVEMYDTAAEQWSNRAQMNMARMDFAYTVFDKKIYVFGGRSDNQDHRTIERYDPSIDSWELLADSLPYTIIGASACTYNGVMYITGGVTGSSISTRASLNTILTYNPTINEIKSVGKMQIARQYHQTVVYNDKLLIVGGVETDTINKTKVHPLKSIECFSPGAGDCSPIITTLDSTRWRFGAAVIGKQLVIFGGRFQNEVPTAAVDVYSLSDGSYTAGKEMPFAAEGVSAVTLNGRVYVMGGGMYTANGLRSIKTMAVYYP